ncbi:hypothetical protein AB0D40_38165 [Streptomyces massasporeus]|uniref:hypothetical protein n=1 Tax=Streptomyces massasporeus TaxID=67324 RepID=UPI0033F18EFF
MAAEGERPEGTSSGRTGESATHGRTGESAGHFTTGGGWVPVPVPPPDEDIRALLALLGEVRSDLARLQSTREITALRDECDAAVEEISRTGRVTPDLAARLRARLEAAGPAPSVLASGIALARSLDLVEARPRTPRPSAESAQRARPSGRSHPGAYGNPAGATPPVHTPPGHTPPGPSTGSDDDEWPDPADG